MYPVKKEINEMLKNTNKVRSVEWRFEDMLKVTIGKEQFRDFFTTIQNEANDYFVEIEEREDFNVKNTNNSSEHHLPISESITTLEQATKKALQMYENGNHTIEEITYKTGVSKCALYGALAKKILDL